MRVILDTNVFVSGVFFSGPPYRILEAWRDGNLTLVVSMSIMEEYRRVGEKLSLKFEGVDLAPALMLLATQAVIVEAKDLPENVCRDPDDDKLIACALAAQCDIVVTGDKDLLDLREHEDVQFLSPRSFLEKHLKR